MAKGNEIHKLFSWQVFGTLVAASVAFAIVAKYVPALTPGALVGKLPGGATAASTTTTTK